MNDELQPFYCLIQNYYIYILLLKNYHNQFIYTYFIYRLIINIYIYIFLILTFLDLKIYFLSSQYMI